ncbi:MAG TPA: UvrD-helicase domain-containing protein, partial [Burkholderiaceae bacterium]
MTAVEPDDEQRRIIESKKAVVQVAAYAGTGKTTVIALTQRRKVDEGAKAGDFLALTFTRTGRNALKRDLLGGTEVRTLHSFARWLVQRERGSVPRLLTEDKELALIRTALEVEAKKLTRGRRKEVLAEMLGSEAAHRQIATFFAQVAASGRSARAFVEEPGSRHAAMRPYLPALELVGRRLRKLKKRLHVTAFADMIGPAIKILKKRPSLPFRHLQVDEWQDCPPDQAQLVQALIPLMDTSLVVG